MTHQIAALTALIIFCTAAQAELYRWTDEDGNTHFSDTRPEHLPTLEQTELHINTAMPAYKAPPKPKTQEGPEVIIIGSKRASRACSTAGNGIIKNSAAWDAYQDKIWKNCRGMR